MRNHHFSNPISISLRERRERERDDDDDRYSHLQLTSDSLPEIAIGEPMDDMQSVLVERPTGHTLPQWNLAMR